MEMYGNEIKVQQGEDFNLDILLSASQLEYIPFIVSSERANPFFVITIASTKYEKNLRYVKSWWNDIKSDNETPTFFQTVPYDYGEIAKAGALPTLPPTLKGTTSAETPTTRLLYQYTIATEETDKQLGHRPYHYFYFDYDRQGAAHRRDNYECHIRFNFSTSETSAWGSQNYMYQVTLVSGELIEDVLDRIAKAHGMPADWPEDDIEAQYKYVKVQWPNELQEDIDASSPLGRIDAPEVILAPTKLQVFNNLRKII